MPLYDDAPAFLAALPAEGRLAGFDVGEKTIGVAVRDPARMIASPLFTQRRTKWTADAQAIRTALADRAPIGFVVGLPLHMTGETSPRAPAARQELDRGGGRARSALGRTPVHRRGRTHDAVRRRHAEKAQGGEG